MFAKQKNDFPRSIRLQLAVAACLLCFGAVAAGWAAPEADGVTGVATIDAKALATIVQSFDKVQQEKYPWGWIRWLMNSKLDPGAEMTLGIVQVDAHQRNPMHVHANCEEQLLVLSGSCKHVLGKETVVLNKGDVIRIPQGVAHKAWPIGDQPLLAVIVYSSGDRRFEVVDE